MAMGTVIQLALGYYFIIWTQQSQRDQAGPLFLGLAYAFCAFGLGWAIFRSVWFLTSMVGASQALHNRMFASVVRLPMRFFDTNPLGRILNRFSKDVGILDDMMPDAFFDVVSIIMTVLGVLILTCVIIPVVILAIIPLVIGFVAIQRRYLLTSRETKRLEAVSRSPIYSQFSESLQGAVTIRAFGARERFSKLFYERLDTNVEAYFAFVCTARWLSFRLDTITLLFTGFTVYGAILLQYFGFGIPAGLVGLALAYLVRLGGAFQYCVRMMAEFENQLVSVERILSYVRMPSEAPPQRPEADAKLAKGWPTRGDVEFLNYSTRYAPELPLVLRGLSCKVPGGSKVAIVGRTGAGKSSFVQALFRLVEADGGASEGEPGRILLDGVDVASLGLRTLRGAMSVIPQQPWLFSGSIRQNLDPFSNHKDAELWSALSDVQLDGVFPSLSARVTEAGGNLSTGQKQLICLARAILRASRVIVCDEATAHVDHHTDAVIQKAIRTKFKGRTVVMIAHRLHTIIDCDIVLVLDAGQLVEAGHPHQLLSKAEGKGVFVSMVNETGSGMAAALMAAAKRSWDQRSGADEGKRRVIQEDDVASI